MVCRTVSLERLTYVVAGSARWYLAICGWPNGMNSVLRRRHGLEARATAADLDAVAAGALGAVEGFVG